MTNDLGRTSGVGFSRKRFDDSGRPRWTALYRDLRGKQRSAGTWPTKKAADKAWQDAEAELRRDRLRDPSQGRQTFRAYVEKVWFPHHQVELTTREKYTSCLNAYLLPYFGSMRMIDIMPQHVREWMTWAQNEGASAWTIQYCKTSILSSIHHGAERPGHRHPPVPRGEDAVGACHGTDDRHAGAVRRAVQRSALCRHQAACRDRYRERASVGRADRAPGPRCRSRHPDRHGEPEGHRDQPEVPPDGRAVPGR